DLEKIKDKIKEIIFLGDVLISYGDFLENNCKLLPSGYDEQWWQEDLKMKFKNKFKENLEALSSKTHINKERLTEIIFKNSKPSAEEAIKLSKELEIPLHPEYTYYWKGINPNDVLYLREWLSRMMKYRLSNNMEFEFDPKIKRILENIWMPHKCDLNKSKIFINESDIKVLEACLIGGDIGRILEAKNGLEAINLISNIRVMDIAPTFVGLRMGRPEKAKERKMKPPIHVLFPVGREKSTNRNIVEEAGKKIIEIEAPLRICKNCGNETIYYRCSKCGSQTDEVKICEKCGLKISGDRCKRCNEIMHPIYIMN
ncbi:MAG: hypothetical protein QXY79_03560, partial [Candidatus Methanomethylicia archaeon]